MRAGKLREQRLQRRRGTRERPGSWKVVDRGAKRGRCRIRPGRKRGADDCGRVRRQHPDTARDRAQHIPVVEPERPGGPRAVIFGIEVELADVRGAILVGKVNAGSVDDTDPLADERCSLMAATFRKPKTEPRLASRRLGILLAGLGTQHQ